MFREIIWNEKWFFSALLKATRIQILNKNVESFVRDALVALKNVRTNFIFPFVSIASDQAFVNKNKQLRNTCN